MKPFFLLFCLCLVHVSSFAQKDTEPLIRDCVQPEPLVLAKVKIGGQIRDLLSETPLIAVKIKHKESGESTISDLNGHFSITIPNKFPCTLNIQYMNLPARDFIIKKASKELNIVLHARFNSDGMKYQPPS